MTWSDRLKEIMRERGLKQKDLADMLGMTQPSVFYMMQGDVRLSSLEKLASALNVPVSLLLESPQKEEKTEPYDEKYRETHVHGYIRIGKRVVEVNSLKELKDAVTACEVNYLE